MRARGKTFRKGCSWTRSSAELNRQFRGKCLAAERFSAQTRRMAVRVSPNWKLERLLLFAKTRLDVWPILILACVAQRGGALNMHYSSATTRLRQQRRPLARLASSSGRPSSGGRNWGLAGSCCVAQESEREREREVCGVLITWRRRRRRLRKQLLFEAACNWRRLPREAERAKSANRAAAFALGAALIKLSAARAADVPVGRQTNESASCPVRLLRPSRSLHR